MRRTYVRVSTEVCHN